MDYDLFWNDNDLFSQFNVSVNQTYGEYHRCNPTCSNGNGCPYECYGKMQQNMVGREVPWGKQGFQAFFDEQCGPANEKKGEWLSFPAAANNPQGWMVLNRVKSIRMGCLAKLGVREMATHTTLHNATLAPLVALLEKGLRQCPDMPPPEVL